jgi:hypothetical protein
MDKQQTTFERNEIIKKKKKKPPIYLMRQSELAFSIAISK